MKGSRGGFTLIELIIVVLLILTVYSLVFTYVKKNGGNPQALSALTLKSSLIDSGQMIGHTTFLCINRCTSCYIRHGINEAFTLYNGPIHLKDTIAYTLDASDSISKMEYGRYEDQPICLKLDFYPNGSSTKVILENPDGVYYLPSFFGNPQQVNTLEEATSLWLENTTLLSHIGDYY